MPRRRHKEISGDLVKRMNLLINGKRKTNEGVRRRKVRAVESILRVIDGRRRVQRLQRQNSWLLRMTLVLPILLYRAKRLARLVECWIELERRLKINDGTCAVTKFLSN